MSCPILKTLRVSFTAPSPAPPNGYRVKWRVVGTTTYTTAVGPFTSSPASVTNVPACEDIEGTIEAVCGAVYSAVASFTAPKEASSVCGSTISGTTLSSSFYIYPKKLVDLSGSADSISLSYDVQTIPNRINIYNSENNLVVTSGWKGVAAYAGPWGASISTATTGTLSFLKSTGGGDQRWYTINAEHAGNASITDAWTTTLSCAAVTSTYTITPSSTSVNEGGTITFNVATTNVPTGTVLYYSLAGISGADVSDNALGGSFTITNNAGSFSKTFVNDTVTEGAETFTASVRVNSVVGEVKATSVVVTLNDTSSGAGNPGGGGNGTPTYSATVNQTSVSEGSSVVFTVNTTNVVQSSTLYYSITGTVNASDFVDNTLTGSFVVTDQIGTITKALKNDVTTEGFETIIFRVYTGSPTGTLVATAPTVNVIDSSITGGVANPTYTLGGFNANMEEISVLNEGNNLTIRLETTNVTDGTTVAYAVTGITQADLAGNSDTLTGNFVINNSFAVKNFYINADSLTEGTETFTITLTGKNVSKSVTINDTSQTATWTGYNLYPSADDQACTSTGAEITVFKNNSPGSILAGNTLYASQNLSDFLPSGFYSDGGYKYAVQTGGNVSSKVACQSPTQPAYYLVSRVGDNIVTNVNEGALVTFTLVTDNVPNGTVVPYTISGISSGDLSTGSLSGSFTVGSTTTASFTIANDFTTEGTETMTMTLPNNGVTHSITITDSSQTPVVYYELAGCNSEGYAFTTIAPNLGINQRYVLPSGTPVYYTYTGSNEPFSFPPSGYNGSIQQTQLTGCPNT